MSIAAQLTPPTPSLSPKEEHALLRACVQSPEATRHHHALDQLRLLEQDLLRALPPTPADARILGFGGILYQARAHGLVVPPHLHEVRLLRNEWLHGQGASHALEDVLFCLAAVLRARRLLASSGRLHEHFEPLRGDDFFYETLPPMECPGPVSAWDVEKARYELALRLEACLRYARHELETQGAVFLFAAQLRGTPRVPPEVALLANRARASLIVEGPERGAMDTTDAALAATWFERHKAQLTT